MRKLVDSNAAHGFDVNRSTDKRSGHRKEPEDKIYPFEILQGCYISAIDYALNR